MDEGRQSGWPIKILTNIGLSLHAAGPAAVVVTWIICVTLLGLFGSGDLAKTAIGILSVLGGVLGRLSRRTRTGGTRAGRSGRNWTP